jgi:hypothetical protein
MFNLFRRPAPRHAIPNFEKRYTSVSETVRFLLHFQRTMTPDDFELFPGDKPPEHAPFGYIYGLVDAATQRAELPISCEEGMTLLAACIDTLQDGGLGKSLVPVLKHLMCDPEFMRGVMLGGDDYTNWMNSKGKTIPFGLVNLTRSQDDCLAVTH